jgi:glucokinase
MADQIIGIDIGGTKTAVILSNRHGEILKKESFTTLDPSFTIQKIDSIIQSFSIKNSFSIGISCGGPLDPNKGLIQSPPNLPGWDDLPIVNHFSNKWKASTFLMNDANAGALAEWYFGSAKGYQNIIFLTMGTGMGGGLILNGRLYEGTTGDAGEIGHIRMADQGPIGYGKIGSFEGFCSGGGIAQLGKKHGKDLTTKQLAEEAQNGDPLSIKVFEESAEYLGKGLAILIDILNPEIIILGSLYLRCQDLFEKKLMTVLEKECLPRNLKACKIEPASLSENIGDLAAISVAIYNQK